MPEILHPKNSTTPGLYIDITRLLGRLMKGRLPTGVDRVCLAYIHRYGNYARALIHWGGHGWTLSPSASRNLFTLLLEPTKEFRRSAIRSIATSPPQLLPDNNRSGAFLFNIGHSGLERPGYAAWIARKNLRPLFMVHDLIPITHPEYCRPGELQRHTARMDAVLHAAAAIVTNSQATLDELSAYAETRGLPLPPSVAALLAPPPTLLPLETPPMQEPYFVMVSTIEPRKNHWMLLQVWRRLVEQHGADRAPRLVVIGQRGWECENVVDLLERGKELQGVVTELAACSDTELATWLRHARALLFPSFCEGYGLPLVEALVLGTPAIAGNLPVFREIAADIPEYIDPLDGLGWQAAIEEYSKPDSPARADQLERLQHYSPPTWKKHFAAVDQLLGEIA
jgi:glycosyltransferase involved in cell wall biosynthesis